MSDRTKNGEEPLETEAGEPAIVEPEVLDPEVEGDTDESAEADRDGGRARDAISAELIV